MDIFTDIERATQISWIEENPSFVPVEERTTMEEAHNRRKPPKNINLLDNEIHDSFIDIMAERSLNENEIASSIKVANGGITYSNEHLENYWKLRQMQSSSNSEASENNDSSHSSSASEVTSKNTTLKNRSEVSTIDTNMKNSNNEDYTEILKKCKLSKNAAIAGLLKNNLISANNLQVPNKPCVANTKHASNTTTQNDKDQGDYTMNLVLCPEEEEVFVQPIQAHGTIDESKYKDIDFTVAHVGKKKIVTPRQFYINEVDDSFFDFVKKDSHRK